VEELNMKRRINARVSILQMGGREEEKEEENC